MADTKDYNKLTVATIKELFKSRGIPTTKLTKKQQLIDRLVEVDAEEAANAVSAAPQTEQMEDAGEDEQAGDDALVAEVAAEVADTAEVVDAPEAVEEDIHADGPEGEAIDKQPAAVAPEEESQAAPESASFTAAVKQPTTPMIKPVDLTPAIPADEPVLPTKEQDETTEPAPTPVGVTQSEVSQPIVPAQELNDAVEAAPIAKDKPSPRAAPSPSEDSRKRKRRSATPPVEEHDAARKRPKPDEDKSDQVTEDTDMREAHVAEVVSEVVQEAAKDASSAPNAPDPATEERLETTETVKEQQRPRSSQKSQKDVISRTLSTVAADMVHGSQSVVEEDDGSVEPSIHPATSALYIRNLKRPLKPEALEKHLVAVARGPASEGSNEDANLATFHLDSIRTHAFAVFNSVAAASRARSALHQRQWPAEPERERLWVDFVPEDKVASWIEAETAAALGGRPGMKRWEVVYDTDDNGETIVTLQEIGARGPQMGNASLGRKPSVPLTPISVGGSRSAPVAPPPEVQHELDARSDGPIKEVIPPKSFLALDALFESTNAKPKLYYKPVSKELANKRLDELDRRSLPGMRGSLPMGGSGLSDSRRYTFEDQDLLVDGGPEFGLRGPGFPLGRGGRSGRGGRGRGGWR